MKARYKHVSLPEKLMDEVDNHLEGENKLGFQSRAEMVKYLLRKYLENGE